MSVEEGEDLLRISSKVVVAILEASSRVLNSEHFLLFGSKHIEGFLRVFRVLGPCVVSHLMVRLGIVTADAKSCGVMSAAGKAPIFSGSRWMSS